MATTTKELSLQLEEVTKRLRALESGQHVMTSSPGLPLEKWNDHGFVHRHEIKPIVRALNNGGGSSAELEERVEVLESGQYILTSSIHAVEANQYVLTSAVNRKQDKLIAGSGIEIEGNVISASGGASSVDIMELYAEQLRTLNSENAVLIHESSKCRYYAYQKITNVTVAANSTGYVTNNINYPSGTVVSVGGYFSLLNHFFTVKGTGSGDYKRLISIGDGSVVKTGLSVTYNTLDLESSQYRAQFTAELKNSSNSEITLSTLLCMCFAIHVV